MADPKTALRFDHREIAVIFSLFVFVTLLMFTVGILVGKGLTQAKYDGKLATQPGTKKLASAIPMQHAATGSSVSTSAPKGLKKSPHAAKSGHHTQALADTHREEEQPPEALAEEHHDETEAEEPIEEKPPTQAKAAKKKPLKLIPKDKKHPDQYAGTLQEPAHEINRETASILNDPKIKRLLEDEKHRNQKKKRASHKRTRSRKSNAPISYPDGNYTVQVGSYPNRREAQDRVKELKKLGFPYAYFSAKKLGENNETWYRVWLGYYPSSKSAKTHAELLQKRGEVRNYLVRKTTDSRR